MGFYTWPIENWFMVDLSSKDAPGTKTVKRNQLERLRSKHNIIRHWMGIFSISTCAGYCSSRFNMSMKSVKVTTIKNHEAIWKSSKLSFPIWFCPCSTEPRILFRDSIEVTGFFFPTIPGVFWCYYGKVTCWLTVWSLGRSFGSGLLSLWCLQLMDTDGGNVCWVSIDELVYRFLPVSEWNIVGD